MSGTLDLTALFESGDFADLTIRCKDWTWLETHSGEIDLSDNEPLAVDAMLRFFYKGAYNTPKSRRKGLEVGTVTFHAAVFILADKYQLDKLAECSYKHLSDILDARAFLMPRLLRDIPALFDMLPPDDPPGRIREARKPVGGSAPSEGTCGYYLRSTIVYVVTRDYVACNSYPAFAPRAELHAAAMKGLQEAIQSCAEFGAAFARAFYDQLASDNSTDSSVEKLPAKCLICGDQVLLDPQDEVAKLHKNVCRACIQGHAHDDWAHATLKAEEPEPGTNGDKEGNIPGADAQVHTVVTEEMAGVAANPSAGPIPFFFYDSQKRSSEWVNTFMKSLVDKHKKSKKAMKLSTLIRDTCRVTKTKKHPQTNPLRVKILIADLVRRGGLQALKGDTYKCSPKLLSATGEDKE
ncbi:hypothetical protein NA57DRAFT_73484 [Rhizodiscina lignyota]|uniref:Uncharacterized protein n=1 Tax=Rhizodiscina lignyota TaxID=1504668 RepID=A0A9P4IIA1_9PEZI|nr:hypothetical protein NA57DRAFT_73484 [Rhizodiscina lignyota]